MLIELTLQAMLIEPFWNGKLARNLFQLYDAIDRNNMLPHPFVV